MASSCSRRNILPELLLLVEIYLFRNGPQMLLDLFSLGGLTHLIVPLLSIGDVLSDWMLSGLSLIHLDGKLPSLLLYYIAKPYSQLVYDHVASLQSTTCDDRQSPHMTSNHLWGIKGRVTGATFWLKVIWNFSRQGCSFNITSTNMLFLLSSNKINIW